MNTKKLISAIVSIIMLISSVGLVPVAADTADTSGMDAPPVIIETVSPEGFIHPGVLMNAEQLRTMQKHVRAGDEPWATAFAQFSSRPGAGLEPSISYNVNDDDYRIIRYGKVGLNISHRSIADADTASKQAIMWVITGNVQYRKNCMNILRLWSLVEKAYPHQDQQIRWGISLKKFCFAAELMKYTECKDESLKWSKDDDTKFKKFLHVIDFTVSGWWYFFNQHNYAVGGYMAENIFNDDKENYAITVERATVNSAYEADNRGRNGSLKYGISEITENAITGEKVAPNVQVAEMGRDQAHAEDGVGVIAEIAMTTYIQGTKVDPEKGTISTASNAVNLFNFLDDRLLKGTNYCAKYNLGNPVTYYPCWWGGLNSWGNGHIGTIMQVFGIAYNYYKYVEKRDMTTEDTKYLAQVVERWQSPEDDGLDFMSNSTLLYTPESVKQIGYVFSKDMNYQESPTVSETENFSALRSGSAQVLSDEGTGTSSPTDGRSTHFLRTKANEGGTEFAIRHFGFPQMQMAALRVRTNGTAKVRIGRGVIEDPTIGTFIIPDTKMQWKTIYCDFSSTTNKHSSRMAFYTVSGNASIVDIDSLDFAPEATAPVLTEIKRGSPVFSITDSAGLTTDYACAGYQYSVELKSDVDSAVATVDGAPDTAVLKNNILTWTPTKEDNGKVYKMTFCMNKDGNASAGELSLVAYASAADLLSMHIKSVKTVDFDKAGTERFNTRYAEALKAAEDGINTEKFVNAVKEAINAAKDRISPIATYDFVGTDGKTQLSDKSGAGEDMLTLHKTASIEYNNEKASNVLSLDGKSSFVSLSKGIVSDVDKCTISAWVNMDDSKTWMRVFDFGSGTSNYMFLSPHNGAGKIRFAIRVAGSDEEGIDSAGEFPKGGWHHIAVTLNGEIGTLYLDGKKAGENTSMTFKPSDLGVTPQNWIGCSQWPDPFFKGRIADFRIYSGALKEEYIPLIMTPAAK